MKPCLLFFLIPAFAFAQTAAEMDMLLDTQAVGAAQAAHFVLGAAALLPPDLSGPAAQAAAFEMAKDKGWLHKNAYDAITLRDTALLVMNAFAFKGGIFFSLFPGPRYAYREMLYRKIIQGRSDPVMIVSGPRLLQIIGRALSFADEGGMFDTEPMQGGSL